MCSPPQAVDYIDKGGIVGWVGNIVPLAVSWYPFGGTWEAGSCTVTQVVHGYVPLDNAPSAGTGNSAEIGTLGSWGQHSPLVQMDFVQA